MPKKPKGYGKSGRPKPKDIKNLKIAKDIIQGKELSDIYLKAHPLSSEASAKKNSHRLVTEEVMDLVKNLLQADKAAETTRANLEKMLHVVVARYLNKEEHGAVYVAAIKLLSQLVPDFKDRHEVDNVDTKSEKEIDEDLKKYGFDPEKFGRN